MFNSRKMKNEDVDEDFEGRPIPKKNRQSETDIPVDDRESEGTVLFDPKSAMEIPSEEKVNT
ncbi:hypothetical protein PENTCL1PPCAC_20020 [Pristionchus entomophagus]|uniref:Uncharacterized protein n=1 Tax=Pristionchus entomophagus TaxID=358040 RepID=A0AAV5TUA2_9BILA|nr:hypothetical protein PENTCL1PPCAC_20020 [Pristionchus entomophagus]